MILSTKNQRICNLTTKVILFALLISFGSCTFFKKEKVETYDNLRTQKINKRDSLFIIYTVARWHDSDAPYFGDYSKFHKMSDTQVRYSFGGVFYSPDKKKILVWIVEELPNAKTRWNYHKDTSANRLCPISGDTVYNISAVVGYRNDTDMTWNLYPLGLYSAECYNTRQDVINLMSEYCFSRFKNALSMQVLIKNLDSNYGGKVRWDLNKYAEKMGLELDTVYVIKEPGYNIQDKEFWNKNLIWQNGSVIKGYYYFQIIGLNRLFMPTVKYPHSILNLFKSPPDSLK